MADAPQIHPLRQRMIEGMSMRGLAAATQRNYLRVVRACAKHAGKPPGDLTFDDARAFQIQLMRSGASISTINSHAIALRFFFRVTLRQPGARDLISLMTPPQRIPEVLTPEEVAAILEHAPSVKWRAALSVAYGAGLRACEVCNLKVGDIDSKQMLIRVEQGKRYEDRFTSVVRYIMSMANLHRHHQRSKSARPSRDAAARCAHASARRNQRSHSRISMIA